MLGHLANERKGAYVTLWNHLGKVVQSSVDPHVAMKALSEIDANAARKACEDMKALDVDVESTKEIGSILLQALTRLEASGSGDEEATNNAIIKDGLKTMQSTGCKLPSVALDDLQRLMRDLAGQLKKSEVLSLQAALQRTIGPASQQLRAALLEGAAEALNVAGKAVGEGVESVGKGVQRSMRVASEGMEKAGVGLQGAMGKGVEDVEVALKDAVDEAKDAVGEAKDAIDEAKVAVQDGLDEAKKVGEEFKEGGAEAFEQSGKGIRVTAERIYDSPEVKGIIGDGFEEMSDTFKEGRQATTRAMNALAGVTVGSCAAICPLLRLEIFRDFSQTTSLFISGLYDGIRRTGILNFAKGLFGLVYNAVAIDISAALQSPDAIAIGLMILGVCAAISYAFYVWFCFTALNIHDASKEVREVRTLRSTLYLQKIYKEKPINHSSSTL